MGHRELYFEHKELVFSINKHAYPRSLMKFMTSTQLEMDKEDCEEYIDYIEINYQSGGDLDTKDGGNNSRFLEPILIPNDELLNLFCGDDDCINDELMIIGCDLAKETLRKGAESLLVKRCT